MNRPLLRLQLAALLCVCCMATAADPLQQQLSEGHLEIDASLNPSEGLVPGQKIILTLKIATDRWFAGGTRISIPEVPGLVILQTEQFASNASETRGSQSWVIQRWTLDVYAQRTGEFTIPPIKLQLKVNAGDAGNLEGTLFSPATSFATQVPAPLAQAQHWVASPEFSVSQNFDRDLETLQVGDAIEREIRFEASDVMAMMLPTFSAQAPDGLAVYPSPPTLQNNNNRGVSRATRSQRISYVIEQEGQYRLPSQDFFWWNTATAELQLLSLPETEFSVGAAAAGSAASKAKLDPRKLLSVAGALLFLGAMLWLGWRYLSTLPGAKVASWLAARRQQLRRMREPALAQTLNPGSSAAE